MAHRSTHAAGAAKGGDGAKEKPIWNFVMLNWVISLVLVALVSGFFIFAGTGGAIGSLLARIAVAGCSVVAAVMLGVHLWHRSRHPKAG